MGPIESISVYIDAHSTAISLWTYWAPVLLVAVYSVTKITELYRKDVQRRVSTEFYLPKLTTGTILGYVCLTVVPVVNLVYALFTAVPAFSSQYLVKWWEAIFDTPLVPDSKTFEQKREELRTEKMWERHDAQVRANQETMRKAGFPSADIPQTRIIHDQ